jgi:hypothetical protein
MPMPKRMPDIATGEARLAQRLKEKVKAASAAAAVVEHPDRVEPDVIEQLAVEDFAPDPIHDD